MISREWHAEETYSRSLYTMFIHATQPAYKSQPLFADCLSSPALIINCPATVQPICINVGVSLDSGPVHLNFCVDLLDISNGPRYCPQKASHIVIVILGDHITNSRSRSPLCNEVTGTAEKVP